MKLIRTPEQFKKFYPYKSPPAKEPQPPLNKYPKRYPCFVTIIDCIGGIMGDCMKVKIIYPPKNCDLKSFKLGLTIGKNIDNL